jgi:hypothetical protein
MAAFNTFVMVGTRGVNLARMTDWKYLAGVGDTPPQITLFFDAGERRVMWEGADAERLLWYLRLLSYHLHLNGTDFGPMTTTNGDDV